MNFEIFILGYWGCVRSKKTQMVDQPSFFKKNWSRNVFTLFQNSKPDGILWYGYFCQFISNFSVNSNTNWTYYYAGTTQGLKNSTVLEQLHHHIRGISLLFLLSKRIWTSFDTSEESKLSYFWIDLSLFLPLKVS